VVNGSSPDGPLREAFRIVGLAAVFRLAVGGGDREQRDGRDAEPRQLLPLANQLVERHALHAGHRRHRLAASRALDHEHRIDEVAR
jgi:hypothetical protein